MRMPMCASLAVAALATAGATVPLVSASAAAKLPCHASMSVTHPSHNTTTDAKVTTAGGAWVATFAHYKTVRREKTTHANAAGHATLAYDISRATYGYKVVVTVYVDKGTRKGSCKTSFTPMAASASTPAPNPTPSGPAPTPTSTPG